LRPTKARSAVEDHLPMVDLFQSVLSQLHQMTL
jgi:hypothetical protein